MRLHEVSWSSSPNDLWNLLNLRPATLRLIYCDQEYWGSDALKWESVRQRRKKFRQKIEKGVIILPRRTEDYQGPEEERERVRERRSKQAPKVGEAALRHMVSEADRQRLHTQLDTLIDEANLPPDVIQSIRIKKISTWQMGYKDGDNEAQSLPLVGLQLEADPRKFEPEWPPITRVESKRLPRKEQSEADKLRQNKKAIILSDPHPPYTDEQAWKVCLDIIRDAKPDKVVWVGDVLDLAAFSRFAQRPEFAKHTQEAIIQLHQMLAQVRMSAPKAEIVVVEGNHDNRIDRQILANNMAAYGLKRADQPEGWPVLSVPFLCAFDQLDVEYVAGYPANRYWINQNLQVRHGQLARKGNTAVEVAREERVSTIFGHVHRVENQYLTYHHFSGGKTIGAWSIGCLCKIDGSVPSTKNGYNLQGQPVTNYENWQQGLAVVDYEDGDGAFAVQPVYINTFDEYKTVYGGKVYKA